MSVRRLASCAVVNSRQLRRQVCFVLFLCRQEGRKEEQDMPRLNQPLSLRKCSLKCLARHFEVVCYGPRRRLADLIEDGTYLTVPGPFVHWRKSLFTVSLVYYTCDDHLFRGRHCTQLEHR